MNKEIYTELSINTFKDLLNVLDKSDPNENAAIIIKLGATWCGPCQRIATTVHEYYNKLPKEYVCFDLDVDENLEIFMAFKKFKMATSIPTMLAFTKTVNRDMNHWYIPQLSYVGSDKIQINNFFLQLANI
jgi:thiol-disulfide isomerase/thioredoxin